MTPEVIQTEVFAELPARLRKSGTPPERLAAGKTAVAMGSFLEGPSFDRTGNLYVTDLAWGRIFKVSPKGEFELVIEYDGEPNGIAIHKDGRVFVADHKHGILYLKNGDTVPVASRYHQQRFKGVNDLTFDADGNLYFTDQGVTDLADPTGCVYRYTADGKLEQLANCLPSPNGLVFHQNMIYVAVTRANAVWRLPLTPDGKVVRLGVFLHLSGGRGPDGMAIDEKGGLAVAHIDMGAVWIFSHRGETLCRVNSCGSDAVTNVAYQGNELYITDSGSGCILRAKVPTPGRTLFSHQ
ncbi:MAG TPA: SMP-30/gluconolactonase/LRE family protein [Burkholderiales bacterium]|nr:SMP-30/gluconolactonase/LRE family protein [Burkholderiales bacterium]